MIPPMTTRVRSVLLAAALVLALSGCVKIDADLKVSSDETVSGTLLMAIDKAFAEQMGQSPDKLKEQVEKTVKEDLPDGVDCKPYEEGKYLGTECSLDDVPFSEMSDSGGTGMKFEKSGERFVVSGGAGGQASSEIPANFTPEVEFKITMPGKIIERDAGAQVDGKTATYTDPKKMTSIRLVSEAGGGGIPAWLIILLVVLVLGAAGAVVFFLLKGRNKSGGAQQFPGQQYPGQQGQWGPQQGQWGPQQGQWGPQQGGPQPQQWGGQQGPQQGQWGPGPQQGQPQGQQPPQQWGQPGQGQPGQGQQPPRQQPPQRWGQPGQGQPGQGQPGQGQPGQGQPGQGQPPQQWGRPGQPPQGGPQGPR
jgi:hypothetical protein